MILSTNFTKSSGIHARAVSARSGKILLSISSNKSGDVGVGIVSISAGLVVFCLRSSWKYNPVESHKLSFLSRNSEGTLSGTGIISSII